MLLIRSQNVFVVESIPLRIVCATELSFVGIAYITILALEIKISSRYVISKP